MLRKKNLPENQSIVVPSEDILKMLLEEVRIRVGAHAVIRESEMAKIFEPVHYAKAAPSW